MFFIMLQTNKHVKIMRKILFLCIDSSEPALLIWSLDLVDLFLTVFIWYTIHKENIFHVMKQFHFDFYILK